MSNSQQMKKGLSVRDLITTGILAALYMVCAMIGEAIFGFFPVLTFLCPLSIALLCGPVYMLILAKVPKHGPIIVTCLSSTSPTSSASAGLPPSPWSLPSA